MVINSIPNKFKIKVPEKYSEELNQMYDFVFDELCASWAGSFHYIWNDQNPEFAAQNQDGFLYVWKDTHFWRLTADSSYFTNQEIYELILDYSIDKYDKSD